MFDSIEKLPDDPILNLSVLYKQDTREEKIDVGVGVFQTPEGYTPIMRAVKAAEKQIWEEERTKTYCGVKGNDEFNQLITQLVLGNSYDNARTRTIQSVAGTGALRLLAEMLASLLPDATVWLPDPTWGNHHPIFKQAGHRIQTYPYYDLERAEFRREAFFAQLSQFGTQDIVLLHGCCHNPAGEDLTPTDWDKLSEMAQKQGFLPVVDFAYLGFGEGIDADAYGVRKLASCLPNLFVATSCSKNFGLYRERVGALIMMGNTPTQAEALLSHAAAHTRAMISMPPNHGAEIVSHILATPALRQDWEQELSEMCAYIRERRHALQSALEAKTDDDWSCVTRHRGMFTLLPLGKTRVERLQKEYGIYLVGTGRINIAGLTSLQKIDYFAKSIAATK